MLTGAKFARVVVGSSLEVPRLCCLQPPRSCTCVQGFLDLHVNSIAIYVLRFLMCRSRCPDQPDPRPDPNPNTNTNRNPNPNPNPNPSLWGARGLLSRSAGAVLSYLQILKPYTYVQLNAWSCCLVLIAAFSLNYRERERFFSGFSKRSALGLETQTHYLIGSTDAAPNKATRTLMTPLKVLD